jgi:hypothetical protein
VLDAVSKIPKLHEPVSYNSIGLGVTGAQMVLRRLSTLSAPGTTAVVYNSTNSICPIPTPGGGQGAYLVSAEIAYNNLYAGSQMYVLDRLTSASGLVANVTTLQSFVAGPDVSVATSNMTVRRGASNYSDVLWAIEIWTTVGSTSSGNITITYTNAAGTSGQTIVWPYAIGGTGDARTAQRLVPFSTPDGVRSVQSLTLTTSTATAGNIGVSAFRVLGVLGHALYERQTRVPWSLAATGLPTDCCLEFVVLQQDGSGTHLISPMTLAI